MSPGRILGTALLAWLATVSATGSRVTAAAQQPVSASVDDGRALLKQYCVTCHNQRSRERGAVPVAFEQIDLANVAPHAKELEGIVVKMRAGLMPPASSPRPTKEVHDRFVAWLEGSLDRVAAAQPNPGRTEPVHRLNRAEYRNAVRDLLDLDIDVSSLLPADDASYGFDNIAGVLKMSPTLMERYLSAAQRVSRLAVGTVPPVPRIDYFRVADDLSQDSHLPGMPLGTRGGTRIPYVFPMDATYEVRVRLARDLNESMPLYTEPQIVDVLVDGERVGGFTLAGVSSQPAPARPAPPRPAPTGSATGSDADRPAAPAISQVTQAIRITAKEREARNRADESWNLRVPVKAGQREVIVTFANRTPALDESVRLPFLRPYPAGVNINETRQGAHLWYVEVAGPYDPTGPGDSPSRRRIFTCTPAPSGSRRASAAADACAKTILSRLARRAYRRAVTDADVQPLLAFYKEGGGAANFDAGIERAIRRLLVSPEFLARIERDPAGVRPGQPYRISDRELASRLSFFLWSSIPDDQLLDLAEKNQLGQPEALAAQVTRMLADPRADAFVKNFAGQWLFLRNLQATVPVQSVFPDFDDSLRQAFRTETEMFFDSIVRENRSAWDLLRADYTFLNERLAKHYGVPNVRGSHFRRVTMAGQPRHGLLGQGSILSVTSYPDRTSPVVRGKWILENLLGTPPPPPLPNVGDLKPTSATGAVLSMRERLAQHRANPVCASCHSMMDPLGLSLENFDATGKWRTLGESSTPIDASGVLPDGTRFDGPAGLRDSLLRSNRFVTTLTEKMMTYALGRGVEYYDAPAVRAVMKDAAKDDYRLTALIQGIVQSTPFRMRRAGIVNGDL